MTTISECQYNTDKTMRVRRTGKHWACLVGVISGFSHCRIPVPWPAHNSQRVKSNVGNGEKICLRVLKSSLVIMIDLQTPITLSMKPYVADLSWWDSERKTGYCWRDFSPNQILQIQLLEEYSLQISPVKMRESSCTPVLIKKESPLIW